jgi:hypothetical protein
LSQEAGVLRGVELFRHAGFEKYSELLSDSGPAKVCLAVKPLSTFETLLLTAGWARWKQVSRG